MDRPNGECLGKPKKRFSDGLEKNYPIIDNPKTEVPTLLPEILYLPMLKLEESGALKT